MGVPHEYLQRPRACTLNLHACACAVHQQRVGNPQLAPRRSEKMLSPARGKHARPCAALHDASEHIHRERTHSMEREYILCRATHCTLQVRVLAAMPLISCPPLPPPPISPSLPPSLSRALSLALSVTVRAGPFLNFLALHEQRKQENSERLEALKMTFWPFAVAGGFL